MFTWKPAMLLCFHQSWLSVSNVCGNIDIVSGSGHGNPQRILHTVGVHVPIFMGNTTFMIRPLTVKIILKDYMYDDCLTDPNVWQRVDHRIAQKIVYQLPYML